MSLYVSNTNSNDANDDTSKHSFIILAEDEFFVAKVNVYTEARVLTALFPVT